MPSTYQVPVSTIDVSPKRTIWNELSDAFTSYQDTKDKQSERRYKTALGKQAEATAKYYEVKPELERQKQMADYLKNYNDSLQAKAKIKAGIIGDGDNLYRAQTAYAQLSPADKKRFASEEAYIDWYMESLTDQAYGVQKAKGLTDEDMATEGERAQKKGMSGRSVTDGAAKPSFIGNMLGFLKGGPGRAAASPTISPTVQAPSGDLLKSATNYFSAGSGVMPKMYEMGMRTGADIGTGQAMSRLGQTFQDLYKNTQSNPIAQGVFDYFKS